VTTRYDAQDGTCYLARPDQHVAACWQQLNVSKVKKAVNTATCNQAE
jgi:3-(3-hydroxy-phenyl)propionate hydroxylase